MEQLAIGSSPDLAKLQCSTEITPIIDPEVTETVAKTQAKSGKHVVMKIRDTLEGNNLK